VGTLLYNARVIYPTLIVPLRTLASHLSTATSTTIDDVSHLLDYCRTHTEASIRYYVSDMQLKIHSDASYLSEPKAKSRIFCYFYLGNKKNPPRNPYPMAHFFAIQQYSHMWSPLWPPFLDSLVTQFLVGC
jgi:hypothetical protein